MEPGPRFPEQRCSRICSPTVLWWLTHVESGGRGPSQRSWTVHDWVMVHEPSACLDGLPSPRPSTRLEPGHAFSPPESLSPYSSSGSSSCSPWAIDGSEPHSLASGRRSPAVSGVRPPGHRTVHNYDCRLVVRFAGHTSDRHRSGTREFSMRRRRCRPLACSATPYPGTTPVAEVSSLGSILDRYAGRTAPVFDFADEPGVVYYLLNRVPGAEFYFSNIAQTPEAQQQVITDLQQSRPPIAILNDTSFGIPELRRRPRCHPLVCHRRVPVHPLHAPRRLPRPAPPPAG